MQTVKPISDLLQNYDEVLSNLSHGSPIVLTDGGVDCCALLDIAEYKEYRKMMAWRQLMSELEEGRRCFEEGRYYTAEEVWADVEAHIRGRANE